MNADIFRNKHKYIFSFVVVLLYVLSTFCEYALSSIPYSIVAFCNSNIAINEKKTKKMDWLSMWQPEWKKGKNITSNNIDAYYAALYCRVETYIWHTGREQKAVAAITVVVVMMFPLSIQFPPHKMLFSCFLIITCTNIIIFAGSKWAEKVS